MIGKNVYECSFTRYCQMWYREQIGPDCQYDLLFLSPNPTIRLLLLSPSNPTIRLLLLSPNPTIRRLLLSPSTIRRLLLSPSTIRLLLLSPSTSTSSSSSVVPTSCVDTSSSCSFATSPS